MSEYIYLKSSIEVLSIAKDAAKLIVHDTVQFAATIKDSIGNTIDDAMDVWGSEDD